MPKNGQSHRHLSRVTRELPLFAKAMSRVEDGGETRGGVRAGTRKGEWDLMAWELLGLKMKSNKRCDSEVPKAII